MVRGYGIGLHVDTVCGCALILNSRFVEGKKSYRCHWLQTTQYRYIISHRARTPATGGGRGKKN